MKESSKTTCLPKKAVQENFCCNSTSEVFSLDGTFYITSAPGAYITTIPITLWRRKRGLHFHWRGHDVVFLTSLADDQC